MNFVIAVLASRVGLRVRAPLTMVHVSGVTIPAGTLGRTKSARFAGRIVGVQWDGRDDELDWLFASLEVIDEPPSAVS